MTVSHAAIPRMRSGGSDGAAQCAVARSGSRPSAEVSGINQICDDGSLIGGIKRLRRIGWSDRSIARHMSLPLDAVQNVLGIKIYDTHGNVIPPMNLIVEAAV